MIFQCLSLVYGMMCPTIDTVKSEIEKQAQVYAVSPKIALRIAEAESSYKYSARNVNTNRSTDLGIFQINSIHGISDECRLNYMCNINWSIQKMSKEGYGAWYSSAHNWK